MTAPRRSSGPVAGSDTHRCSVIPSYVTSIDGALLNAAALLHSGADKILRVIVINAGHDVSVRPIDGTADDPAANGESERVTVTAPRLVSAWTAGVTINRRV